MIRIDNLNVVHGFDIASRHHAIAGFFKYQRRLVAVVQFQHHALEVQKNINHVFLHAIQRGVFVQHAGDTDFRRGITRHG